jgi:hypothetical protein
MTFLPPVNYHSLPYKRTKSSRQDFKFFPGAPGGKKSKMHGRENYKLMLRTVPKVWAKSKPDLREPSGRFA